MDDRALRAAVEVAADHGVDGADAAVIASGSNVLIHLRPADVVARVMTGTAGLHGGDPHEWLERELSVTAFAAERGAPVVAPSDALPPGPHERDGLWITFWRFVHHNPSLPVDPAEAGRALRELHDALAEYPGELRPLRDVYDDVEKLIHATGGTDAHAMHAELRRLKPVVFEGALATQPLHGDTSLGNLLQTPDGLLWNDFEDVCRGPAAWDVAGLVAAAQVHGRDDAFVAAMLDGYGHDTDVGLEPFVEAHLLYLRAWRASRAATRP